MKTIAFIALILIACALPEMSSGATSAETARRTKDTRPILVITGYEREAAIAEGPGVETLLSAANPSLLRSRLTHLRPDRYRAILSFGIAGGLQPSLQPGQIILANEVVSDYGVHAADPAFHAVLVSHLASYRAETHQGRIAGVDQLVSSVRARSQLRARTGAEAMDMESQWAAEFALENRMPFAVLRAIADPASETLPAAARIKASSDGQVNLLSVFGSLLTDPTQIPALMRLDGYTETAYSALSACRQSLNFANLAN